MRRQETLAGHYLARALKFLGGQFLAYQHAQEASLLGHLNCRYTCACGDSAFENLPHWTGQLEKRRHAGHLRKRTT